MWTNFYIGVRSQAGSPRGLAHELTAALTALSPDLKLTFRPVSDQVDEALAEDRLVAALSGFVAALALLLAAIGLYGVTACNVERQRPEIGIRLALGARPDGVLRLVLSRVVVLVGAGILIGGLLSAWASRFAASLLFEVSPRDPVAFTAAAAALAVVTVAAAFVPAYQAARIDPAEVLRRP
jgi:ABC-type antimicrobial peptide transport system permease subunit